MVLALIVIIGALAMPVFYGSLKHQQLRSAADMLRTDLAKARNRAMSTGQTLGLTFSETSYTVGPASEVLDENEANSSTPMFQQARDMPEGIKLTSASAGGMAREAAVDPAASGLDSLASGGIYAYFYPDGTTSTVEFLLTNDKESSLTVSLRGITGVALVQDTPSQNQGIITAEIIPTGQGGTP